MDAVEERLKALVAEELGMQVDRAVGAQVGKALADKKSGAPAGSQWFGSGGASDSAQLEKGHRGVPTVADKKSGAPAGSQWFGSGGASDSAQLEKVVRGVLGRLYKERIGQVDWLLQINGASVVASSPSLALCSATDALCRLRNIVSLQTDPTTFLRIESSATWWWSDSSGSMLGNCWAMAGAEGFVQVARAQKMASKKMEPKVFVLQHAPSSISADNATSAPLKFRVRGYEGATAAAGEEGVVLVEGEYNPHAKGKGELMSHLQTFAVTKRAEVRSVRLEVLSNHGKEAFTCLYHMRMHGDAKEAAGAK
ncbi:UNC-like C-terminal-domain-containing protein [Baffinella frigidus]|nr:UNC-like C-terminal-domain-containing protein [Cryptophyta sp. CCMP2293]